jgi:hypothetical protein
MEHAGILQSLAELSVGVLGFSGVVAVLGRRSAGEWTVVDRVRFFAMVRLTVSVLVLAVLPFPFHSAGLTDALTWAWCSSIAALVVVLNFVVAYFDGGLSRAAYVGPATSKGAIVYTFTSPIAALILFVMNATGIGLERSFTPYLVGILLVFGAPIVLFVRLLRTAIGPGPAT